MAKPPVKAASFGVPAQLRNERERLGFSQDDLAAKLGVSRGTQFNYEKGKGTPDAAYLWKFGEMGADIGYIFSGERTTPKTTYRDAVGRWLPLVASHLKKEIDPKVLMNIFDLAAEDAAEAWVRGLKGSAITQEMASQLIKALFEDHALLGRLFAYVEKVLRETDATTLSAAKKASIILSFFRISRERGKLDTKVVEIAVKAAA